jgi:hypothetical protein
MTVDKIVQLADYSGERLINEDKIPFNLSEIITLLEITRVALADADTYEQVADDLDLSDDYLFELRGKLQKFLDNPAAI